MARNKEKNADDPAEGPILSEEEWAEFERSFTKESTKSASYKEPSARQRELTEKWKKEQPKDTGWRTDGTRANLSPKAGGGGVGGTGGAGGTGGSWTATRKRRRPWVRNLVWVLVALLVTFAILGGPSLFSSSKSSDSAGTPPADTQSATAATTSATAATSAASGAAPPAAASPTYTNPDDQYFDGSPSMDWQNNEAGIVPPAATRVGNYSAKTVGDAYAALRQMLITADLDPAVLRGAEPTALFKLLDPSEGIKQDYEKRAAKPGRDTADPKAFATRFNPQTTRVLGKTIKVHGTMSAAVDKDGNLIVTGDYSFVYALTQGNGQGDGQGQDRSLVRRVWNLEVQPTTAGSGTGYWFSGWWYDIANDKCNVTDGFINPSFGGYGGAESGKTVDPYATTAPPPAQTETSAPSGAPSSSASADACNGVKPV